MLMSVFHVSVMPSARARLYITPAICACVCLLCLRLSHEPVSPRWNNMDWHTQPGHGTIAAAVSSGGAHAKCCGSHRSGRCLPVCLCLFLSYVLVPVFWPVCVFCLFSCMCLSYLLMSVFHACVVSQLLVSILRQPSVFVPVCRACVYLPCLSVAARTAVVD